MTDVEPHIEPAPAADVVVALHPDAPEDDLPPAKLKIKWLRLVGVLGGLGLLAAVSTAFGMMMAVASDLPRVEVIEVSDTPSRILARSGHELGKLTGNENRILVRSEQIAPVMKQAIVSVEDRRFYTNSGIDVRGIGRALWQDIVSGKVVQGGSTIAQQLVKNRLEAQSDRTILQKAREAALAFHMTREWPKDKILTNYLNTIYFGNGAYGIEAAAKTYFGKFQHQGCGTRGQPLCAEELDVHEAALIAGVVASPTMYDPATSPAAAKARRDLVLRRMLEQGFITQAQYDASILEPIPTRNDIEPPNETSSHPYFTTWVRQQVVDKVGPSKAFEGGLRVRTTIDPKLQTAAEEAIERWPIGYDGTRPAAALVALDNDTSEVLALVGGDSLSFNDRPFNLATQGQRQPGSAFKPFVLAEALSRGVRADSVWTSKKKTFCVTRRKGKCVEAFEVNNYEDAYAGITTLARATTFSDNSVYAELGIQLGPKRIARRARRMGIRTSVSSNPAMTLGGLREGVTVLDMAHAYQTFARRGRVVYGTLSPGVERYADSRRPPVPGPVGIREIRDADGDRVELEDGSEAVNKPRRQRVLSEKVAAQVESLLTGVVKFGTGERAALGPDVLVAGKTGTTENYGDAWFVGWSKRYTVAVWVGYPDELRSMETEFAGEPVAGGTYPALIWHDFVKRAMEIYPEKKTKDEAGPAAAVGTPGGPPAAAPPNGAAAPKKARRGPRQQAPGEPERQDAPGQADPDAAPQDAAPPPEQPAPEGGAAPGGGGASAPPG